MKWSITYVRSPPLVPNVVKISNSANSFQQKGIEIWARPVMPVFRGKYSYAIVFLNRRTDGTPSEVSVTLRELGLDHGDGYHITDLYDDYDYGIVTPERRFKVDVNPSGSKCSHVTEYLLPRLPRIL